MGINGVSPKINDFNQGIDPIKFQHVLWKNNKDENESYLKLLIENTPNDKTFYIKHKEYWELVLKNQLHKKILQNGTSLVRLLVELGLSKVLQLLLKHRPNLRQTSEDGDSSLHFLCKKDWNQGKSFKECAELLAFHGEIDINALNKAEKTPIEVAIEKGNRDAVELLMRLPKIYLGSYKSSETIYNKLQTFFGGKIPIFKLLKESFNKERLVFARLQLLLRNHQLGDFSEEFKEAMEKSELNKMLSGKLVIFLQEACKQDRRDVVMLLLRYGADPSARDPWNDSRSAISVAVEYSSSVNILKNLLERASLINFNLEHARNNKENFEYSTALCNAIHYHNNDAMLEILDASGTFKIFYNSGSYFLEQIPPDILGKFLDKRIKFLLSETDKDYRGTLVFDCNFFREMKAPFSAVTLLKKISQSDEQRELLMHPVLAGFVLKQCEHLKIFSTLNLVLYFIFCVLLSSHTYSAVSLPNPLVVGLLYTLLAFLILRELIQILMGNQHYFASSQNYLELLIIGFSFYLLIANPKKSQVYRPIGAFVTLLSWFGFLLDLGKNNLFSVQVQMFTLVLKSFFGFFLIYVILIFAFAFSFFILFHDCGDLSCQTNEFSGYGESVFKTMIMMSGEFDASSIPFSAYPISSQAIFILFVFVVAIVLLNLLNGIAVYDTQKIRKRARLEAYVSRVALLASFETFCDLLIWFRSEKKGFGCLWNYFKMDIDYDLIFPINTIPPKLYQDILSQLKNWLTRGSPEEDITKRACIILKLRAEKYQPKIRKRQQI